MSVSPYMLDALMRDYWCAVLGHHVSWYDTGTNADHAPGSAVCHRCQRLIDLSGVSNQESKP